MNGAKKSRISPAARQSKLSPTRDHQRHEALAPATASNAIFSRFARAPSGDKFADFVSHMELIARIANGISLTTGLIEASIPVDDVIAELLHMGSIKPDQLISLNQADMTAVMDMLKNAPAQLKASDKVKGIEDLYVKMNAVIKANIDSQAYNDLTGKADYENALGNIINTNSTAVESVLKDLIYETGKIETDLIDISRLKGDESNAQQIAVEKRKLETINDNIEKVGKEVGNLQPAFAMLNSLKELEQKSSFVQMLFDELNARKNFVSVAQDPTSENDAASILKQFDAMGALFAKHQTMLSNLNSLADSLQSGRQAKVQYTAGLPKGVKDLDLLPADIDDKWFKSSANVSQQTSRDLRKGLMPLEGFKANLKSVESAWQPALSKVDKATDVFSQQISIANQAKNAATRTTKISALKNCQTTHKKIDIQVSDINSALQSIESLNNKIREFADLEVLSKLTGLDAIKKAIQFTSTSDSDKLTETTGIVKKLKAMREVAEAQTQVQQFVKEAKSLENFVSNLDSTAQGIQKDVGSIGSYHTETLGTNFLKWSDCLKKDVGKDGEVVAEVIESIRKVREMGTTPDIADAVAFTSAVLKSTSAMKSAKSSAESMKSVTEKESKLLNLLKTSTADSLGLGLAAQGMAEIKKADDSRGSLAALMGDLSFLQTAADNAKNNLAQDDYNALKTLDPLQKSLTNMYTEIDTFKPSVNNLVGTDLKSIKPVLAAASNIKNVKVDAKNLRKAVAALAKADPSIQQQLTGVTSSLDTLDALDLEFSSFKMGGASGALDNLDLFFANWAKAFTTRNANSTPSPPNLSGNPQVAVTSATGLLITTAAGGMNWALVGGIIGVGCVLVVVGGVIVILYIRKKREPVSDPKQEKVNQEGTSSGQEKKSPEAIKENENKMKEMEAEVTKAKQEMNKANAELEGLKQQAAKNTTDMAVVQENNRKLAEKEAEMMKKQKEVEDLERQALLAARLTMLSGIEAFIATLEAKHDTVKKTPRIIFDDQVRGAVTQNKKYEYNSADVENARKRRNESMWRIPLTAVEIRDKPGGSILYINANFLKTKNGSKWIMCQGPLDGTEDNKLSTLSEHWMMIDQMEVKAIAQLCNFEENGENKCAHYYPEEVGGEMSFGDYKVKTLEKRQLDDLFTVEKEHISVLRVQFTKGAVSKTVDVVRYFNWPDQGVPANPQVALEIIRFLESCNSNVIVHCSAGVGRTGTLVGIKKGIEICETGHDNGVEMILTAVRSCRYSAVQNEVQFAFMILAITKAIVKKHKQDEFVLCYPQLQYYYEEIRKGAYLDLWDNDEELADDTDERDEFVEEKRKLWEKAHPDQARKAETVEKVEQVIKEKKAKRGKKVKKAKKGRKVKKDKKEKKEKKVEKVEMKESTLTNSQKAARTAIEDEFGKEVGKSKEKTTGSTMKNE